MRRFILQPHQHARITAYGWDDFDDDRATIVDTPPLGACEFHSKIANAFAQLEPRTNNAVPLRGRFQGRIALHDARHVRISRKGDFVETGRLGWSYFPPEMALKCLYNPQLGCVQRTELPRWDCEPVAVPTNGFNGLYALKGDFHAKSLTREKHIAMTFCDDPVAQNAIASFLTPSQP